VGKGKKRRTIKKRHRWRTQETRAEVAGIAGSPGTYRNTPSLGQPGIILGDPDTSVLFEAAKNQNARVTLQETDDLRGLNRISVEAWAYPLTAVGGGGRRGIVVGPYTGGSAPIFDLSQDAGNVIAWSVTIDQFANQLEVTIPENLNEWTHYVGTWNGQHLKLYENGVLAASIDHPETLQTVSANQFLHIATYPGSDDFNGYVDEVAVYEKALSAGRVLAHYTAATARGWPEQTAGTRIADIVTHALWSEASIQTSGRNLQPVFKHGQPKLEEISESMHAEGPQTLFFFNGSGDPVYLGHEWKATASAYNTVQATFGDGSGEIPYENVELVYDNETFNEVTTNREGGTSFTAEVAGVPRRANSDFTDVLLANDNETESLAGAVLDFYKTPALRPATLTVNGVQASTQIGARKIGHLVRVKRRGQAGGAIDRVTHIIGYRKSLGPEKHLTCTWNLARGFDATLANNWRAGIAAFSEAGQTTRAA
jgi:hypothetical protein